MLPEAVDGRTNNKRRRTAVTTLFPSSVIKNFAIGDLFVVSLTGRISTYQQVSSLKSPIDIDILTWIFLVSIRFCI